MLSNFEIKSKYVQLKLIGFNWTEIHLKQAHLFVQIMEGIWKNIWNC